MNQRAVCTMIVCTQPRCVLVHTYFLDVHMEILLQLIISGVSLGMIYAVIAFGYQLTFATSATLNFGQGEALMLGALVGLSLVGSIHGGPYLSYWLVIPIVIAFGALQGIFVERIGVRPAIKQKSEFGWIMSTIALAIIFKNVAENIWGRDDLMFPAPVSAVPFKLFGANVQYMQVIVVVGALAMMAAVELFNRKSIYGKAVVATSNDRDAAGLMGINTSRVITFSYALSSATAAFAGMLIAPLTLTGATMGAVLGLKAFAVAIIGGLTSGVGAIVGGLLLGISETLTGFYISTGYKEVPGLLLLLLVLAIKPAGLFGKAAIKKV
jgi:branched-chain amino acid transport system permease protein